MADGRQRGSRSDACGQWEAGVVRFLHDSADVNTASAALFSRSAVRAGLKAQSRGPTKQVCATPA